MDIWDCADALLGEESCKFIAKLNVPAVAGLPEIMPEAESIASPLGREPETDQRYGGVPPVPTIVPS
jgi:hypothetical protein